MGQDGTILTNILKNNYTIYGICRQNTEKEKIFEFQKKYNCEIFTLDLTDFEEVKKIIEKYDFDSIINFAGTTDVINPWENTDKIYLQNCKIPLNFLHAIEMINKDIFFFQSSSSLMYARNTEKLIDENSALNPMYPYGITKSYTHNYINEFRTKFNLKCCSGIFFNHESKLRKPNFVTKKVVNFIHNVKNGDTKKLNLYDLNNFRDISHAEDLMCGVRIVIENKINNNLIFSSGQSIKMLDFIKKFFEKSNLNFDEVVNYTENSIISDYDIVGNNSKLISLGWKPKYNINKLIENILEK